MSFNNQISFPWTSLSQLGRNSPGRNHLFLQYSSFCNTLCKNWEILTPCWWACELVRLLWKAAWRFLTKRGIPLPYDSAITLQGIYLKELKTYVHTKTYRWMLIEALLVIVKTWKQPGRPFGKWVGTSWDGPARRWNFVRRWKEIKCQATRRHGGTLNACCHVREADVKRP